MANSGDKRLNDWQIASKKYCDLLEERIEELRGKIEIVPDPNTLTTLAKKSEVIQRAGQCFRDDVERALKSPPPKQSIFGSLD